MCNKYILFKNITNNYIPIYNLNKYIFIFCINCNLKGFYLIYNVFCHLMFLKLNYKQYAHYCSPSL